MGDEGDTMATGGMDTPGLVDVITNIVTLDNEAEDNAVDVYSCGCLYSISRNDAITHTHLPASTSDKLRSSTSLQRCRSGAH